MLLREIINYQVAMALLEAKGKFNQAEFKKLTDINQMYEYLEANTKKLGEGSSRIVYLLSNRYVLKLAHPNAVEKGVGQNKAEAEIATNPKAQGLVAAVYDVGPDNKWIISEIARPLTSPDEFEQLTGVEWNFFVAVIRNYKEAEKVMAEEIAEKEQAAKIWARRGKEEKAKKFQAIAEKYKAAANSNIIKGSLALIREAGVMAGDIWEVDHWAKTADGRVILIDYGFTKDIVHLYKQAG